MRVCDRCRKEYPLTPEFWHRNKISKDGFRIVCKKCLNQEKRNKKDIKKQIFSPPPPPGKQFAIKNIENYGLKVGQKYKFIMTNIPRRKSEQRQIEGKCIENFKTFILLQLENRTETILKTDILTGRYKVEDVV